MYIFCNVLPVPVHKKCNVNALNVSVTIIDAIEKNCANGEEPIFWRLITNLAVNTIEDAIEKVEWYNNRWKIEVFHSR